LLYILVGFLGRGIASSQVLDLHRTEQHSKTRTYIHFLSRIQSHDPRVRAVQNNMQLRPCGHRDG